MLASFLTAVNAQSGKTITTAEATVLDSWATDLSSRV